MSKWKVLERKVEFKSGFVSVNVEKCQLPDGRIMPRYYTMNFPDWVNVIPITRDNKIVIISQYRHSASEVFIEIPGGGIDIGLKESSISAAKRELEEETGYHSDDFKLLGSHFPNPAQQSNQLHTFIAKDCDKIGEQKLDPFEDLSVQLVKVDELLEFINSGKIKHSLILASLMIAMPELLKLPRN